MSLGITVGQQDGKTYVFGDWRFLSRVQHRACYSKLFIIVYYTLNIRIMLHHNITVPPFDQYVNRDLALFNIVSSSSNIGFTVLTKTLKFE